jgi:hypothetical protein
MTLKSVVPALALLLATRSAVAAPPATLPECVRHAAFAGITRTDGNGNVLGDPDTSDWGCLSSGVTPSRDVGPAPPPTSICLLPAYPNPTIGNARLHFTLPRPAGVSLTVYGQHGQRGKAFPVRTLASGNFAAGEFVVEWDLKDDQGVRLASDTYRAVLVVEGHELCGDIEVH